MVSIKENWTELTGRVVALRASDKRPGFVELHLQVEAAAPVRGFDDLLSASLGPTITVNVKKEALEARNVIPGARLRLRVRRGQQADDLFAHTEHLEIEGA